MNQEDLIKKKEEIEKQIKRSERSNMHYQLSSALNQLNKISEHIATTQNSLNAIWKRTKQIEQEIKNIIMEYCEPSPHLQNLLKQNPFP